MDTQLGGVFSGRKVLVTGDTGFKGSWLSVWLSLLGAEVTGVALPPLHPEDHFVLLGLDRRIRHIEVDLRDFSQIDRIIEEVRPEFVFHLAAQSIVRQSYQDPKLTFDTNVGGGVNLLEAVRHCDFIRVLIFVTSDKCYENREWLWGYRENDALGGRDPYSISKACAELAFHSYQLSFFEKRPSLNAATVRAGNVVGGGDWAMDRIVVDCVRALRDGIPIKIRNPGAVRPWQHVLEPLYGYLLLAARLYGADGEKYRGSWNFGPNYQDCRTVLELATSIVTEWGTGSLNLDGSPEHDLHEANFLYLNCDKARGRLGWKPAWGLAEMTEKTVAWYRGWLDGRDVWTMTTEQIDSYREKVEKAGDT